MSHKNVINSKKWQKCFYSKKWRRRRVPPTHSPSPSPSLTTRTRSVLNIYENYAFGPTTSTITVIQRSTLSSGLPCSLLPISLLRPRRRSCQVLLHFHQLTLPQKWKVPHLFQNLWNDKNNSKEWSCCPDLNRTSWKGIGNCFAKILSLALFSFCQHRPWNAITLAMVTSSDVCSVKNTEKHDFPKYCKLGNIQGGSGSLSKPCYSIEHW